jgi:hypothetical protein
VGHRLQQTAPLFEREQPRTDRDLLGVPTALIYFDLATVCPLVTGRPRWDGTRALCSPRWDSTRIHTLFHPAFNHLSSNYGRQGTSIRPQAAVSALCPLARRWPVNRAFCFRMPSLYASTRIGKGVCRNLDTPFEATG